MDKPRVLVSASPGQWTNYRQAVLGAGGLPTGGYCPAPDLTCQGLLLAGGGDLVPDRYGQRNQGSEEIDPARDGAELELFAAFAAAGKPILGICRGHQLLNVALGGTLIQDLGPVLTLFHRQDQEAHQDRIHMVRTAAGSALAGLYRPVFAVNSAHHQAIEQVGEGLIVTAWSESGVVEAVEHTGLPILGVQFHPERMSYARRRPDAADGSKLFVWFINRCREAAGPRLGV